MGKDGAGRRWACSDEDAVMKKGGGIYITCWKGKKLIPLPLHFLLF